MTDKYYGRPVLLVIAKYNEFKSFFINTEVGIRQGAKMFWGGAFAMKSAIRQSSFGALKRIFASLRRDLANVLVQNKID